MPLLFQDWRWAQLTCVFRFDKSRAPCAFLMGNDALLVDLLLVVVLDSDSDVWALVVVECSLTVVA